MKSILTALALLSSACAYAQEPIPSARQASECADSHHIAEMLKGQYGEVATEAGITAAKNVLVLFTSHSSWTLVNTRTSDGLTCIIGVGRTWSVIGSPIADNAVKV